MPRHRSSPPTCAQCGADIPKNARACPECGADERTGWDEQSIYDGLDLPEPEAENTPPRRRGELSPVWLYVAILLIVVLALTVLGLLR